MSLYPYDDLARSAGLDSQINTLVSADSALGKLLKTYTDQMGNAGMSRIFIFGMMGWMGFLFFFVLPSMDDDSFFLILPLFCLGPIVIGVVAATIYTVLMNSLMGEPDLQVSSVVLRRGEDFQIHFTLPIKRNVTLKSLSYSLVLQEKATYDQGTTTVTETHDNVIHQEIDFDVPLSSGTGVDQQLTFTLPDTAMHTFEVHRNSLHWYFRVHFDIPNFPDFHRNYKLQVLPEVNDES